MGQNTVGNAFNLKSDEKETLAAKKRKQQKKYRIWTTCVVAIMLIALIIFIYYVCDKNTIYTKDETETAVCDTSDVTGTCTDVYSELEHSWSDWTVYIGASYDAPGEERRTCFNCDEYESRAIEMLSGWVQKGNVWYYYKDGSAQAGWQQIDGNWYYFSSGGAMQTGWQQIDGNWYYFSSGGAMQTGWQQIDGNWYYFSSGGAMATGIYTINGKQYTFDSNGVWIG